jgi:hypothetical protein
LKPRGAEWDVIAPAIIVLTLAITLITPAIILLTLAITLITPAIIVVTLAITLIAPAITPIRMASRWRYSESPAASRACCERAWNGLVGPTRIGWFTS